MIRKPRCCGPKNIGVLYLIRLITNHHTLFLLRARIIGVCLIVSFALTMAGASFSHSNAAASDAQLETFVIPVHKVIDLGLAFFIKRSLNTAERINAAYVVLDVNTLGGRVDAALDIRDALDNCRLPTAAYVNKRAISAGALVCLATKTIAMAPGSTIGAATPVGLAPGGQKIETGEKEISFVRAEFRATAERNGHPPVLAEAMVDPDVEAVAVFENGVRRIVSGEEAAELKEKGLSTRTVSPKGKLLTMTTEESVKMGLAGSSPASLDDFILILGLDPENKAVSKVSWSENIVRFLTHPIVSGLLLTLGVLGIFFELQMPGWGISGTFGATCLILFFGGHYLAGLASSVDVLLFVLGVGLIALELLVIPGFGVAGISGMACVLVGIYLALVDRPIPKFSWDYQILNNALFTFIFMICSAALGIYAIYRLSPESRMKKLMVLSASEEAGRGFTASENLEAMVGQSGRSLTHLRPTGRALFAGEPIEVQTEGGFIEKDRPLKVVRVVGNKVFVIEEEKREAS